MGMNTKYRAWCVYVAMILSSVAGMILMLLWIQHGTPITTISTASSSDTNVNTSITTITTISTASSSDTDVNTSITTFILTTRFGGQQGAGLYGLVSQQCFISHLGIYAHIVEPFVIDSVLGHTENLNTTDIDGRKKLKFSDTFNLDIFNRESKKLGYGPIVRLEYFLSHVPDRAILVELQSGGKKHTTVLWDGYNTPKSPCYKGRLKYDIAVCVVRKVHICCVKSDNLDALSRPDTILTTRELRDGIFGKWTSQQMNVIFQHWTAWWHTPITCKHSIEGKIYPSKQVDQYANAYRDTFLNKSGKIVAFVLRFEHLIARNYNVDVCLRKLHQAYEDLNSTLTNSSIFVAADLGMYQSGSWGRTFSLSGIDDERGKQINSTFMNALSDFIDSQWKFDEWDNSFRRVTGGIEDAGYIATLQKSIASTADCLVFLTKGESSFQSLMIQEYTNYHPTVSEQCIHYLCTKDCPSCTHFYTKQLDS